METALNKVQKSEGLRTAVVMGSSQEKVSFVAVIETHRKLEEILP